jgi:crotonobetaine/carnitine-CoA ligase
VKMSADATADEEIRIFVVRKAGTAIDAEALTHWLIANVPRFMVPRYVEFADALPQTPTLKVQKVVLRGRPLDGAWDREAAGIALPR